MIKNSINSLIKKYNTTDPLELCEALNIHIIKSYLGKEINGFFQRTPNGFNIIHLNTNLSYENSKYILAHELGHAILHTNLSITLFIENKYLIKNKFEREADKFAAELLIPDKIVENAEYSELNLEQICKSLCIPLKLMKLKYNID